MHQSRQEDNERQQEEPLQEQQQSPPMAVGEGMKFDTRYHRHSISWRIVVQYRNDNYFHSILPIFRFRAASSVHRASRARLWNSLRADGSYSSVQDMNEANNMVLPDALNFGDWNG